MVYNFMGFGAERFVASLLALNPFGSYNRRLCGSDYRPHPNVTANSKKFYKSLMRFHSERQ